MKRMKFFSETCVCIITLLVFMFLLRCILPVTLCCVTVIVKTRIREIVLSVSQMCHQTGHVIINTVF